MYLLAGLTTSCAKQCVDIAGDQNVDLSVRTRFDLCASSATLAGVNLITFDQPSCGGAAGQVAHTQPTGTLAGWNLHTLTGYPLGASVQSVQISPFVTAITSTSSADFDHIEFGVHSGPLPAPGAIVNADFDGGVCGWRYGPGSGWDGNHGSPTPGSANLSLTAGQTTSYLSGKCVDMENDNIDVVVRSSGDDAFAEAQGAYFVGMIINMYGGSQCGGAYVGATQTDTNTSLYGWNVHSLLDYALPASVKSISYSLTAYQNPAAFPSVYLDHVYIGLHRLFADGFE
jgi:hypothetical protein